MRWRAKQLAALVAAAVALLIIISRLPRSQPTQFQLQQQQPEQHPAEQEQLQKLLQEEVQPAFNEKFADRLSDRAPWEVGRASGQEFIPRSIHHYFSNASSLPAQFLAAFVSWAAKNPNHTVYFWNAAYVEQQLLPQYPEYNKYYLRASQYERDLIARLIILHNMGGVLVENHMRALSGIADYLTDLTCVMAQERTEKAMILYGFEQLPSTSVLACTKNHEFLKFFLRKITDVKFRTGARVLEVNSVHFLPHVCLSAFSAYDDKCKVSYCHLRDRLLLAEPDTFLPIIEQSLYESLASNCKDNSGMEYEKRQACYNLQQNGNEPTPRSIACPVFAASQQQGSQQQIMLSISTVQHAVRRKVQMRMHMV